MKPAYLRVGLMGCLAAAGIVVSGCAASGGGGRRLGSDDRSLKAGQKAPDFKLKRLNDESKTVRLASFRGKKPVMLFFGSYT